MMSDGDRAEADPALAQQAAGPLVRARVPPRMGDGRAFALNLRPD